MKHLQDILGNYLAQQVAMEERLYTEVERQLAILPTQDFAEVNDLLIGIKAVLARHFVRLNEALDLTEENIQNAVKETAGSSAVAVYEHNFKRKMTHVSQMLREDFVALNAAAMGNTLLHTAALAASSNIVAEVALEHLANITLFLKQMNELTPKVVVIELSKEFPDIKPDIGEIAATNALDVWKIGMNK